MMPRNHINRSKTTNTKLEDKKNQNKSEQSRKDTVKEQKTNDFFCIQSHVADKNMSRGHQSKCKGQSSFWVLPEVTKA